MEHGNYFLQFTTRLKNEKKVESYTLANGFSDAYSICKNMGEFIWLDQSSDQKYDRSELIKNFETKIDDFPIREGTVYVSAMQIFHIYQVYAWAKRFKHVKFVLGGPAVDSGFLSFNYFDFPENVTLTNQSVERYLGFNDFSGEWGLEVPDYIGDMPILFTYSLDNYCYWGKCVFCKYPQQQSDYRIKRNIKYEFQHVAPGRKKFVWLQTNCLAPKRIKTILPNLPNNDDIEYIMFVRGTPAERRALEEISNCDFDFSKMNLYMGIEFPSDRMLKWIRKGVTSDNFISFLETTEKMKINTILSYILGWDNLQKSDIKEVEAFVHRMPKNDLSIQKIFLLVVASNTQLYSRYVNSGKLVDIDCGPFKVGYNLSLNKEQIELNEKVRQLLHQDGVYTIDRYNHGEGIEMQWRRE